MITTQIPSQLQILDKRRPLGYPVSHQNSSTRHGFINAISNSDVEFSQHGDSIESPIFPSKQSRVAEGPAESQDTSTLCIRCRKLATQDEEIDMCGAPDTCESCRRNPELAWVTEAAASALTRLAETLRSGRSSEQRGSIRVS